MGIQEIEMCSKCDEVTKLMEQTKGINSGDFTFVSWAFPHGKPFLVHTNPKKAEQALDGPESHAEASSAPSEGDWTYL